MDQGVGGAEGVFAADQDTLQRRRDRVAHLVFREMDLNIPLGFSSVFFCFFIRLVVGSLGSR